MGPQWSRIEVGKADLCENHRALHSWSMSQVQDSASRTVASRTVSVAICGYQANGPTHGSESCGAAQGFRGSPITPAIRARRSASLSRLASTIRDFPKNQTIPTILWARSSFQIASSPLLINSASISSNVTFARICGEFEYFFGLRALSMPQQIQALPPLSRPINESS